MIMRFMFITLGGEISAPADPPSRVIKERTKMVESGKLSLGIPCAPFKLVKFMPSNGELVRREISTTERKFSCNYRYNYRIVTIPH